MENQTVIDGERKKRSFKLKKRTSYISSLVFSFLAIGCLIGLLVAVIMLNFDRSDAEKTLFYILAGSFTGASVLFAVAAVLLSRLSVRIGKTELDLRERLDGEDSFFVGEGTLATFGDGVLILHDEENSKEAIKIPYGEMRFISVCTRTKAREKGEWSVVIEIPVRYLAKDGKGKKNEPPALVQTDGKERLYACLERHGLTLSGEQPLRGEEPPKRKYTLVRKFSLPNAAKRKRAAILLCVGIALIAAALLVGFLVNVTVGGVLGVLGIFVAGRSTLGLVRAKAVFSVYDGGIYYSDSARTERTFLKWEEVGLIVFGEKDSYPVLTVKCIYGDYHYPAATGARELLEEKFPEKLRVTE